MGMDSNVYAVPIDCVIDDFSFEEKGNSEGGFFYWRKHHDMHNWMKKLFIKKGGDFSKHQFNCEYIRLTMEDIEDLEKNMDWYEEQPEPYYQDFRFISEAKIYLNDGFAIYFVSWY